jgi:PD-(D/E)XK nuclease superfamily
LYEAAAPQKGPPRAHMRDAPPARAPATRLHGGLPRTHPPIPPPMRTSPENIQRLLHAVHQIAQHQAEITRLKGERFNIFSILRIESAENKTHSAFLGELLDPKGSHGMDDTFLRLFLKQIGYATQDADEKERLQTSVVLEKHIGKRDDDAKEGGRIDIYITLANGRTISIENKIYAGDQHAQIQRYHNHNSEKNTVYYLTLDGSAASQASAGALKGGADYHCISYRDTVTAWLGACIKEAADQPILRETIKQYLILIQKLTGQLTAHKMAEDLYKAIGNHYEAAKLVRDNFAKAEEYAVRNFLAQVKEKSEAQLLPQEDWTVRIHNDLRNYGAGLYVYYHPWKENVCVKYDLRRHMLGGEDCHFALVLWKDVFDKIGAVDELAEKFSLVGRYKDAEWYSRHREFDLFRSQGHIERLFKNEAQDIAGWTGGLAEDLVRLAQACKERIASI